MSPNSNRLPALHVLCNDTPDDDISHLPFETPFVIFGVAISAPGSIMPTSWRRTGSRLSSVRVYFLLPQLAQRQFDPHLQSEQRQSLPQDDFEIVV
jgi:hypothetical protein